MYAVFIQIAPLTGWWRDLVFYGSLFLLASCTFRLSVLLPQTDDELDEAYRIGREAFGFALDRANLGIKEAAYLAGEHPENFRKRLNGDRGFPITLRMMLAMPFQVWLYFLPELVSLVVQRRLQEFRMKP